MEKEVLTYDGNKETVSFELVELTQVGANSYLAERDKNSYYVVAEHNGVFSNTGMVIFENQKCKDWIDKCAEKTSPESVRKNVNRAIEKDQEVFMFDLELLKTYGMNEEYKQAQDYMAPKIEKKQRIKRQIEEIDRRNAEEKAAEEARKQKMETKHRWIEYKHLMHYIHKVIQKPELEEEYFKFFYEWYESPVRFSRKNAASLERLLMGDYEFLYFLIENYIKDIEISQEGEIYTMCINYPSKKLAYELPKIAYDYVEWRLKQR